MYERELLKNIRAALQDTPVLVVHGARQSGKSTLAQILIAELPDAHYFTLDDPTVLLRLKRDALTFLESVPGTIALDEAQLAPEMFSIIKLLVDRNRTPGRFLLTGSSNILMLPRLSDSLAGRNQLLTLWPLAQCEIAGQTPSFIERIFAKQIAFDGISAESRNSLITRIASGGYPEALQRNETRRTEWFNSYITNTLQRDVRDLANIEGISLMPHLLSIVAARCGNLLNIADLSRGIGISQTSVRRYLALLEGVFFIQLLPAWSGSLNKRLLKTPKAMITDTGLACALLGIGQQRLIDDPNMLGPLLENFVAMELLKQLSWQSPTPRLFHYRSHTNKEVDLVIENNLGQVVGIEVKSSAHIRADDFSGLDALAEDTAQRFHRGIVLHTGSEFFKLDSRMIAMPIAALWS